MKPLKRSLIKDKFLEHIIKGICNIELGGLENSTINAINHFEDI